MARIPVIAVFDIGKTNKKLFLFDEDYNIVHETSAHLDETVDEDGDPCEDIVLLTAWIRKTFNLVNSLPDFDIKAINFSTYGASFVHLGDNGIPIAPLYNYLKPFPKDLKTKFYDTYGGVERLSRTTASPALGNLNSGLQLYLIKHRKPDIYKRIRVSLHLPQYVSSLFTSAYCSDLTSIGCHTCLWVFGMTPGDLSKGEGHYHFWVHEEGIADKLAPIRHADAPFEIKVDSKLLYSGIGLHDSSAALIPYLLHATKPFILLSTGTWCISLNPFAPRGLLTEEELEKDCLYYNSYQGKSVKASRLFSGQFHETKCKALSLHFRVPNDVYKKIALGDAWKVYKGNKNREQRKAIFEADRYSEFESFEEGYTALVQYLVDLQIPAINLVFDAKIDIIYVDGGFSQNKIFMTLLAEAAPGITVYSATVSQASALGAALIIHNYWNSKPLRSDLLKLIQY